MGGNKSFKAAKAAKKDEFYTQLGDIENELKHYRPHFKGKVVLCNCDDPFESNFFKYFVLNFNKLGLKKLVATSYTGSPIAGEQLGYSMDDDGQMSFTFGDDVKKEDDHAYKAVVTTVYDKTGNAAIEMLDVAELFASGENEITELFGDGDFHSEECLKLLDEADIICTNPPFSQFRDYLAILIEHDKQFLIIGNQNNITYKDIFTLFTDNKVWLGYKAGDMAFKVPPYYEPRATRYWQDKNGQKWRSFGNICWYTNLDIKKRHEEMILVKDYDPTRYQKLDNYDAINVNPTADIPYDYDGVMAVPVTFLFKYNPDQFEILGITDRQNTSGLRTKKYTAEDDKRYNDLNARGVLKLDDGYKALYARVLIRNKHPKAPARPR